MNSQSAARRLDSAEVSAGRSVSLFLADGSPQGIVIAQLGNWNGTVLSAPRSRLAELMRRPEAARTGVYILLGPDPDRAGGLLVYVGEADDVAARLRTHLGSEAKDFFDRLAIIVTSDDSLTKAHVRYLESRLLALVGEAGSTVIANSTHPKFERLPEAARADMHTFLEHLGIVLPLVGFDLFRRDSPASSADAGTPTGEVTFTFATAGASATARETEGGFMVLAGSSARKGQSGTFPAGYLALRDALLADGRLVEAPSSGLYRFATDVLFTSPSAAASIVAARSASGPLEWKVAGTGQSYREWRAAALQDEV